MYQRPLATAKKVLVDLTLCHYQREYRLNVSGFSPHRSRASF